MKSIPDVLLIVVILIGCLGKKDGDNSKSGITPIAGTWKLLTGTLLEKGDTVITNYTKNISFIKIINDTHFAFLQHDLNKGKDSVPVYVSGGGTYSLNDSTYIEHLEYCSARDGRAMIFHLR